MLPSDQLELLTAGVDGELTPKEARLLRQLLADSSEAAALFGRLQSDRDRLLTLPTLPAPADLRDRILAKLTSRPPLAPLAHVRRPSATPDCSSRRSWIPLAVAASLLVGVSAASFGFFARSDTPSGKPGGQQSTAHGAIIPALPPEDHHPSTPILVDSAPANPTNSARQPEDPAPTPQAHDDGPVGPPYLQPDKNQLAAPPIAPIPPLNTARVWVPFLVTMMDLERDDMRRQLAAELGVEPAYRIDVFVPDTTRGLEQFLFAARANGVTVLADAFAQDRLRRKQPGPFVCYTEALTPGDFRELFGKIAADDAKQSQRVFDSLHVVPLHAGDQKELRDVLGFDPGFGKRNGLPAPMPPEATTKPISSGTGDQVVRTLTSQPGKPMEKSAVVMSLSPRVNPTASKELAEYRTRRGERKPTAVPVMIVIRTPGG
jgi:hypothetical protein